MPHENHATKDIPLKHKSKVFALELALISLTFSPITIVICLLPSRACLTHSLYQHTEDLFFQKSLRLKSFWLWGKAEIPWNILYMLPEVIFDPLLAPQCLPNTRRGWRCSVSLSRRVWRAEDDEEESFEYCVKTTGLHLPRPCWICHRFIPKARAFENWNDLLFTQFIGTTLCYRCILCIFYWQLQFPTDTGLIPTTAFCHLSPVLQPPLCASTAPWVTFLQFCTALKAKFVTNN